VGGEKEKRVVSLASSKRAVVDFVDSSLRVATLFAAVLSFLARLFFNSNSFAISYVDANRRGGPAGTKRFFFPLDSFWNSKPSEESRSDLFLFPRRGKRKDSPAKGEKSKSPYRDSLASRLFPFSFGLEEKAITRLRLELPDREIAPRREFLFFVILFGFIVLFGVYCKKGK
jgi:hypothetical protein